MKQTYKCKILKNIDINEEVFKLVLERPAGMDEIKSGQFHNLSVNNAGFPYLKRPISVSDVSETEIEFTIKVNGEGTSILREREVGETLDVLGPLGNGFTVGPKGEKSLVIGGGIGVAPVKLLAKEIKEQRGEDVKVLLGFRDTPYEIEEFKQYTSDVEIATENGEAGHKGYVTALLERELENNKYDMVYVCGPHVMLECIGVYCNKMNVPVQLLMEERMACGIGACLVCTCKIKDDTKEEGHWNKRVCKDGPVFMGSEVVFGE